MCSSDLIKPMSHFTFSGDDAQIQKAYFIQLMLEKGFLASNLMYAMFSHTDDHVAEYLDACDAAFGTIATTPDIEAQLKGEPSATGFGRLA